MISRETLYRPQTVSFFFDPICPWTWITSRWLVEVAEAREVDVDWRTLSLAELNGGVDRMPAQFQEAGRFSMRALRMIEAMRATGASGRVGAFYTELGMRLHVDGEPAVTDLLRRAADVAGVGGYTGAADDPSWDAAVAGSTAIAMRLAGPDVGSPVLQLDGRTWGLHGPIVSPAPGGEDALRLWDALLTLVHVPGFYELKRGRTGAPQIQPVEAGAGEAGS
ncbi:MAG: DsbA family protein [Chloroflexi bacterium]|nr:DsbA family protein [Chloroflexota bacterium]